MHSSVCYFLSVRSPYRFCMRFNRIYIKYVEEPTTKRYWLATDQYVPFQFVSCELPALNLHPGRLHGIPADAYHAPNFYVHYILGLGAYNHEVGYPEKGVWYEPTGTRHEEAALFTVIARLLSLHPLAPALLPRKHGAYTTKGLMNHNPRVPILYQY